MRIAHLVSGGEVAGGQLVALQLARAARGAGHEPVFVAPVSGRFTALAREEGFPVFVLELGGALDLRSLWRLRRLLGRERVDLLHTHVHFSLNVLGRIAGRASGAAVVAHMHIENVFRAGRGRRAQVMLDNLTARLCTEIVAVSEATREALIRQGYPAGRVVVVHNGVGLHDAAPEPHRVDGVPADARILLHVGRLAPVKGQLELIEALSRLSDSTAYVVLVGRDLETGGAFERELRRRAATLGVTDRVLLAGYREDVPELLAGADIFVLPSHAEGLPLVVLEAMAAGRPVVASAVGGTPELVVDGETGLLVPPADVAALAAALDRLLADPTRARRLGEAGRRRAEGCFSLDAMCGRMLALYPRR